MTRADIMTTVSAALLVGALSACGSTPGGGDAGEGGGAAQGGGAATGGGAGGGGGGAQAGGAGGGSGGGTSDGGAPDCGAQALHDVMIPMRDGKSLSAFVRAPTDARCRLPTVLIQTPYNKESARLGWFTTPGGNPLFDSPDYAFVVVDWRGFFGSLPAKVSGQQPYGEDGYDTVEWVAQQPFSDGSVVTWGVSALCQQQYKTAVLKPPHLKAVVPIFCEMNQNYAQYYPGGVLRREYFTFLAGYFGAGAVASVPYRTALWAAAESTLSAANVEVPVLLIAGWFDLFPVGSLDTWSQLLASSPRAAQHRLLIGDWTHQASGGETAAGRALSAEELQWVDRAKVIQADALAFFDLHARGLGSSPAAAWAKVRYSRSGAWQAATAWPPPGVTPRDFYLSADGGLLDAAPAAATRTYLYSPGDPSATRGGATLLASLQHGPTDQTALAARGDAVAFASAPLTQALNVAGHLALHLEVSTDRADTDFTARLTDVQPDGGMLLVGEGVRRLKLRSSYAAPQTVTAGTRYGLDVFFTNDLAYGFQPGHRVGLIVSSSNAPRFDANPNTGADFFPDGGSPVLDATNTLYLDGAARLTLPVSP